VHARGPSLVIALLLGSMTQLALPGCRESAEDRREAARATAEAEQAASQTTLTSATIDSKDETEAEGEALREQAEAIVALRLSQRDYRAKLQGALDELDAKRREAKQRGAAHVAALDARRAVLKQDLRSLDRTTDQEWAALKAKIDRDLRDYADERQPQSETR
jgi:hypothetical protein